MRKHTFKKKTPRRGTKHSFLHYNNSVVWILLVTETKLSMKRDNGQCTCFIPMTFFVLHLCEACTHE